MSDRHGRTTAGFTLIELLVVIASSASFQRFPSWRSRARAKTKDAATKAELKQMATAIQLLSADTGKWPNGCPTEAVSNPEVYLNAAQASIGSAPTPGDQGSGCAWEVSDIARWGGTLCHQLRGLVGHNYFFDPNFVPYQNCASKTAGAQAPAVVSFGPNGVDPNAYDCDDIFYVLR